MNAKQWLKEQQERIDKLRHDLLFNEDEELSGDLDSDVESAKFFLLALSSLEQAQLFMGMASEKAKD